MRVRLQVLKVTRHARLGKELAHRRDVAVGRADVQRRRVGDPLDRFHVSLLIGYGAGCCWLTTCASWSWVSAGSSTLTEAAPASFAVFVHVAATVGSARLATTTLMPSRLCAAIAAGPPSPPPR